MASYSQLGQTKGYVSSVSFLDQREILNKVLDVTNEESSFLDIMELTGKSVVTNVPQYHHFVNQELFVLGTAGAATVSAATQAITLQNATQWGYVNAGDLVLCPDGTVAYVTSKGTSPVINIKSVDTTALPAAVSGTSKYAFFSNAAAEGSLSPESRKWGVTKYVNQVQTFKAKFSITDIQKASKVEVEFNGKPFYMYKGQHESLTKFRADISNALMFGRISSSTSPVRSGDVLTTDITPSGFSNYNATTDASTAQLTDAEGLPVQTTMGLDQYAALYGVLQATAPASLSLANYKTITQKLNSLRAPQDYMLYVGTAANMGLDDLLNGTGVGSGAIVNVTNRILQGDPKNIDLGIDSFKLYGRMFGKKYLPILDHPNLVATGSTHAFDGAAYGVPNGKIKTTDSQMIDRIQVRYMANDGTDLKYREILLGGLAPVPTNERSVLEIHYQSTQGLQVLGANHLLRIKG